ncbi:MAG: HAD family hydrolase [Egibacteraceae bacterium]
MIPLAQAGFKLDQLEPRVLFSDVDGTLVGRGGSLFAAFDGRPTLAAARALFAVHRAGLRVVLVSGRTRARLHETGRLLGIHDAIAELGTVLVVDGTVELLWGQAPRDLGETPAQALQRSGALAWLLETFRGRVELHEPPEDRQGTILLRGQLQLAQVNVALAEAGFGWASLCDNGRFNRPFPHLGSGRTHAYHLMPSGVTKASTASAYLARRGFAAAQAAAIGDAPTDLDLAGVVGAMFVVANGTWALDTADTGPDAVITTEGSAGEGWAEAVTALLARLPGA